MTAEEKKVIFASSLGTVFEWYDFYLYGSLAAIIGARLLAKVGTVLLLARPSGLGWRQSLGLGLALQPASSLPLLLTMGDASGIGPEIIGKAWAVREAQGLLWRLVADGALPEGERLRLLALRGAPTDGDAVRAIEAGGGAQ